MLIISALLITEIRTITNDRREQDTKHSAELGKQQAQFDSTMKSFTDLQALIINSKNADAQVAKNIGLPEKSLKRRASELSAQIFSFLTDRKVNEPSAIGARTRDTMMEEFAAETKYLNQTLELYQQTFSATVIAIHDEFARQGIRDQQLDDSYDHPVNVQGAESVAARIGALAERLRN